MNSNIALRILPGGFIQINPAQVLAGYDINAPNLGFQPRAYAGGYQIPEKILSYTASWQQSLPGSSVLSVAYVGSQGLNLFLRSWTNGIVGVTMNQTTGVGSPVLQFGPRFAQIGRHRDERVLELCKF